MKTEQMVNISPDSVTTMSHCIQCRDRGLKRETADVCQNSFMKPEIVGKEDKLKSDGIIGASLVTSLTTTQYFPFQDEKVHIKNEPTSKLSKNLFGMISPFGAITETKIKKESTTTEDYVPYKRECKIKREPTCLIFPTVNMLLRKNLVHRHTHVMSLS